MSINYLSDPSCKDSKCLITMLSKLEKKCGRFVDLTSFKFWSFLQSFLKARNAQITFAEKPRIKINSFYKQKWSSTKYYMELDKCFKGTAVNRASLTFLHEWSLSFTFIVPVSMQTHLRNAFLKFNPSPSGRFTCLIDQSRTNKFNS